MTWAGKRQLVYLAIAIFVFGGLGFLIIYPNVHQAPTCSDQKQNGDESGIDCGGSCAIACSEQVAPLNVIWSRAFKIVDGRYNVVAYIENTNTGIGIKTLYYEFTLVDEN